MKKIILCLAFVFFTLCLFGCHGKVEHPMFEIPEEFDSEKQYEITFWAKNENNAYQREIYANAVAGFESLYPNIKVTLKSYTDYGEIREDVRTNLITDTAPNVCITYPDHVAEYMQGDNVIVPLDELMEDKRYGLGGSQVRFDAPTKDEIIPQFLEECKIGGRYYAMPYMRSTEACYVNKTYVEKLGFTLPEVLTWDFVWEVSKAAMEKDANGNYIVNGKKQIVPVIYKSTDNMMIQMLMQKGAEYSTPSGKVKLFNDTTKELLKTVAENAKLKTFDTFEHAGYPANSLNRGECIFAIDSTAGATWMGCNAPLIDIDSSTVAKFETAVLPIPQFDADNPKMISQGPSVCIFNKKDSGEVLASWLFVQYLLTNDVQIAYSSTEGYLPVTSKAQNSEEYKKYLSRSGEDNGTYYSVKIDAAKLLMDNTDSTFVTPVFSGSASLRNAAGEMINIVSKDARRNKAACDDGYFEALFDSVSVNFRLDQIRSVTGDVSGVGIKSEFGELPLVSTVLLCTLGAAWVFIATFFVYDYIKKSKK